MKKILSISIAALAPIILIGGEIDVSVSHGTSQSTIIGLTPTPAQMDVDINSAMKVVFSIALDPEHVKKNDIRLMDISHNKQIPGAVSLVDGNTAQLKPLLPLSSGYYEISYQSLKSLSKEQESQIKEIRYRFYVPEVVNGYRLPPEPNANGNDSTLLGIDVNGNGIRDDVERYIVKRYAADAKYPKTKTAIALQYAWASQKVLAQPTIESKKHIDNALDCEFYWMSEKTKDMSGFESVKYHLLHKVISDTTLRDKIFNTRERLEAKFAFNASLAGKVFGSRRQGIESCQTNIDAIGE